jgi:CRP-like cAMP-binding protein
VLALLRRGEVFGELSVLGQRPRTASVWSNEASEIVLARREPLGKLMKATPALHQRLDQLYRRRAIVANVYADPLFEALPPDDLERLIDLARLRAYDQDQVVVAAGEAADEFFLVWSGSLRVSATVDGAERVFAYLGEGDYFGETALLSGSTRTATVTANQPSQVVVIGRAEFEQVLRSDPQVLRRLHQGAEARRARARAVQRRPEAMFLVEDLLKAGAVHATRALVIDLDRCVSCGNCAAACHHRYGNSRLVRRGQTFVLPDLGARVLMPASCWHCRDPECMIGCPTDALRRLPSGEIAISEERCIGCEICANQCPWGNITMAPVEASRARDALGRLYRALRGALSATAGVAAGPARKAAVKARAVKCDLCSGRGLEPACIAACPYGAIDHVDPSAYLAQATAG